MAAFHKTYWTFGTGICAIVAGVYTFKEFYQGKRYFGKEQLQDKTVIVTGANSGIGFEVAKNLASRKAKVILACRDATRCQQARRDIIKQTKNRRVVCRDLDLRSMKSIEQFCERINDTEKKIDILVNNAAVMRIPERRLSVDGLEMQIGVNHIGHFMLTQLLLDKLKKSDYNPARIINVSSVAHERVTDADMALNDLNFDRRVYDPAEAYNVSKLANILFTRELAKRLQAQANTKHIHVYAVHPGLVNTNLMRYMGHQRSFISGAVLSPLLWFFMRTPRMGAQTVLYCALNPDVADDTGKYYFDGQEKEPSNAASRDDLAEKLWNSSVALTKHDWLSDQNKLTATS